MAIYQCLFFKDRRLAYWENIEAGSELYLRWILAGTLRRERWDLAEAWLGDALRLRVYNLPPPV
jgi:hypothetical protein